MNVTTSYNIVTYHLWFSYSQFCGHHNEDIPISPSDAPTKNAVEYELEPAPKEEEEDEEEKPDNEAVSTGKGVTGGGGRRNHLVIFAVDISGSMNITTEVPALQCT